MEKRGGMSRKREKKISKIKIRKWLVIIHNATYLKNTRQKWEKTTVIFLLARYWGSLYVCHRSTEHVLGTGKFFLIFQCNSATSHSDQLPIFLASLLLFWHLRLSHLLLFFLFFLIHNRLPTIGNTWNVIQNDSDILRYVIPQPVTKITNDNWIKERFFFLFPFSVHHFPIFYVCARFPWFFAYTCEKCI